MEDWVKKAIEDGKAVKKFCEDTAKDKATAEADAFEQGIVDHMGEARAWVENELPDLIASAVANDKHRVSRDAFTDSPKAVQLCHAIKRVVDEVDGPTAWLETHDVRWSDDCTLETLFVYIEWGTWAEHCRKMRADWQRKYGLNWRP